MSFLILRPTGDGLELVSAEMMERLNGALIEGYPTVRPPRRARAIWDIEELELGMRLVHRHEGGAEIIKIVSRVFYAGGAHVEIECAGARDRLRLAEVGLEPYRVNDSEYWADDAWLERVP